MTRRRALALLAGLFAVSGLFGAAGLLGSGPAPAQDFTFFRIGTGGGGGTYYPVGGMVAHAISHPPGSRPCAEGGSCGVPGLIALGQSSRGSVANVEAIVSGQIESGFVQSDIATWAYRGSGIYAETGSMRTLRAITSLYPESIHLVARKGAGIRAVGDLRGKRVALDERGSGTLVDAGIILEGFGIAVDDIDAIYVKSHQAIERIGKGELDAFFLVAGYPAAAIETLASGAGAELVPIVGRQADAIVRDHGFLAPAVIPAGTYEGIPETRTLALGAQWITREDVDAELIYQIVGALWNDTSRHLLDQGHAKGKEITLETALQGIAIPLHPGAKRYYREAGLIK